jgi:hypothetical protein
MDSPLPLLRLGLAEVIRGGARLRVMRNDITGMDRISNYRFQFEISNLYLFYPVHPVHPC